MRLSLNPDSVDAGHPTENLRNFSEGDPMAKMASQITYEPRNRSFRSCLNTSENFMKIEKVFLVEKSRTKKIVQKLEDFNRVV